MIGDHLLRLAGGVAAPPRWGALVGLLALGLWLGVAPWYVLVALAVAAFLVLLGREL